ncbi:hypothetical protein [Streptomyces sp. NPDC051183]|uniref:hypothetical protein n=1 Tax=Streptomyces sp. NPDC051183 TaxID=3155165 RepID=UPI00343D951A
MATEFDGYTHQQLLAMVSTVDAESLEGRAAQLKAAAELILRIGEGLKTYRVPDWEGAASDAFHEWVNETGNATLRLAEFGDFGGLVMAHAAVAMAVAKSAMPAFDAKAAARAAEKAEGFGFGPFLVADARSRLDGDHREAVEQMRRLAQAYEITAHRLNSMPVPTFPPPPAGMVPGEEGGAGGASPAVRGGAVGGSGVRGGVLPEESGSGSGGKVEGRAEGEAEGDTAGGAPGRVSGAAPGGRGAPDGDGAPGGGPVGVGLDHVELPSAGTASPAAPGPGASGPPSAPGAGPAPTGPVVLPPGGGVISGGRPVPVSTTKPAKPGTALPRGTVIGAGGGTGGGGTAGSAAGTARGIPGGHTGAAPAARGPVAGRPGPVAGRPGPEARGPAGGRSSTGGRAFTEGGSGLVRPPGAAGTAAGTSTPRPAGRAANPEERAEAEGSGRPDYLVEDEETWQGKRGLVPPVID